MVLEKTLFFLNFILFFKLYIIVLVLPNIKMNPPQVYILITANCSHEIKRCLLLGRQVMTNLDSILKSRDITLPTKVHLLEAMVFSVVMYM